MHFFLMLSGPPSGVPGNRPRGGTPSGGSPSPVPPNPANQNTVPADKAVPPKCEYHYTRLYIT